LTEQSHFVKIAELLQADDESLKSLITF